MRKSFILILFMSGMLNVWAHKAITDTPAENKSGITATDKSKANGKIYCDTYNDIAPGDILQTILKNYKGKAVLIDIWATWCGPCRAGHKAMAPLKEELQGQIKFVYITCPTSPKETWEGMIKEIPGDHYYLTKEQYSELLKLYESKGIPTYAIYNKKGKLTYTHIGLPSMDELRGELLKASGK